MYDSPSNIKTPTNDTQEYRNGRYVHRSVDKQSQMLTIHFDTHSEFDVQGSGPLMHHDLHSKQLQQDTPKYYYQALFALMH